MKKKSVFDFKTWNVISILKFLTFWKEWNSQKTFTLFLKNKSYRCFLFGQEVVLLTEQNFSLFDLLQEFLIYGATKWTLNKHSIQLSPDNIDQLKKTFQLLHSYEIICYSDDLSGQQLYNVRRFNLWLWFKKIQSVVGCSIIFK